MNILKHAALGLAVAALTSCGGGGGGSSGGSDSGNTSSAISISLTPTSISENLVQDLSLDLRLFATAQVQPGVTISGTVYVLIVDDKGVIEPDATVTGNGSEYSATLTTNPNLSVGDHKGSIKIEACADPGCHTVYGSTNLSYDFNMLSNTNLKTLSALSGAADWQPLNGNPGRTAYVPVTLAVSAFSPRWLYTETAPNFLLTQDEFLGAGAFATNTTNTVATDSANDMVVLADGPYLIALKETNGTTAWSNNVDPHDFGNPAAPALANGIVYTSQGLIDSSSRRGSELSTYDETTGVAGFKTEYSPNLCSGCGTSPVTVVGTEAFLEPSDNVFAFDAGTGAELWASASGVNGGPPIALDNQDVYFVDDNMDGLVALDQPTGTLQYAIGTLTDELVSLDGAGGAIARAGDQFAHVDLTTQSVDWKTPGIPAGSILTSSATGNGLLYTGMIGIDFEASVVAYSTTDGHQLWSWSAPSGDGATEVLSLIATKNLLFVGTDVVTYAIDVNTHAIVWSYPLGGGLSMSSNGILYIQGSDNVAAINLH